MVDLLVLWPWIVVGSLASMSEAAVEQWSMQAGALSAVVPVGHSLRQTAGACLAVAHLEAWPPLPRVVCRHERRSSTLFSSAAECIVDFCQHILSMGTSYHTSSSSWRNYCMQSESVQLTLVSYHSQLESLVGLWHPCHVRCNVVGGDPCQWVSTNDRSITEGRHGRRTFSRRTYGR